MSHPPGLRAHGTWAVGAALACGLLWLGLSARAGAEGLHVLTVNEPPASFLNAQGRPEGFAVDVVREILRRLRQAEAIEVMPEGRVLDMAENLPDVVFFGFSRTPEREGRFHWITRLMHKPWVFYARDPALAGQDPDGLRGLRLGVVLGDVREAYLRDNGFARVEAVAGPGQNLGKLLAGRLDAILYEPQGLAYQCRKIGCDPEDFVAIPAAVSSDVYLAMSAKSGERRLQDWRRAAREMKEDGTFLAIARAWSQRLEQAYGIRSTPTPDALIFQGAD